MKTKFQISLYLKILWFLAVLMKLKLKSGTQKLLYWKKLCLNQIVYLQKLQFQMTKTFLLLPIIKKFSCGMRRTGIIFAL